MCYSERLTEAGGYAEEFGWVLVGYKVVVKLGGAYMAWSPMLRSIGDMLCEIGDPRQSMREHYMHGKFGPSYRMTNQTLFDAISALSAKTEGVENPIFVPRVLMTDRHGFHVAATEESAINTDAANPFGTERVYDYGNRKPIHAWNPADPVPNETFSIKLTVARPGCIVRVLVPEWSVGPGNHAHAMVVIPLNERETAADIALCNEFNRKHRPVARPEMPTLTPEKSVTKTVAHKLAKAVKV